MQHNKLHRKKVVLILIHSFVKVRLMLDPTSIRHCDLVCSSTDSSENHIAVFSFGAVYYAVQGGSSVWLFGRNPKG